MSAWVLEECRWRMECTQGAVAGELEGEDVVYWNPVLFILDRERPNQLHVFFEKFTPIPIWFTFWIRGIAAGET